MSLNNTVFLRGRLVRDPEMQYTPSGNALTKFTVAVDRYQGKDKEKAALILLKSLPGISKLKM